MLSQGMNRPLLIAVGFSLLLFGCGKKKVKVSAAPRGRTSSGGSRTPAIPAPVGTVERGLASWYGVPYHGRQAADGEIYDMETLVAAHRTLSFQTWVRVRNLSNNKSVDVRIIDRGPFVGGRVIDLSHAAARQIELIGPGVAEVEITVIAAPPAPEAALFAVQVGVFRDKANAERMERNMKAAYGSAKTVERRESPGSWRTLAGSENSTENAEALARRIREDQHLPDAFVVRVDP
jgi:rare lipoprotein A